ncbi:MAG: hypothetical protein WC560_10315 [Syntrophales bacterium]
MNNDTKIFILLISIPLAAVLLIFFISTVKFEPALSPVESKILSFNQENIPNIVERKPITINHIRSPISITIAKTPASDYPKTSLVEMAPPPVVTEKRVSFILVNQDRKIAIIDGKLVSEGDVINRQKIKKIEKNRVLLKDKGDETWLTLE